MDPVHPLISSLNSKGASFTMSMSRLRRKLSNLLLRNRQGPEDPADEDDDTTTHFFPRNRHALDSLPVLPPRRPLTSGRPADPQLSSLFFRLPAELRLLIYRLVLSPASLDSSSSSSSDSFAPPGSEIHLDLRYTAAVMAPRAPHSTRGASLSPEGRQWTWRASRCHRHPDAPPFSDRCAWGGPPPTACAWYADRGVAPDCFLGQEVLGLLRCCRRAYREALPVLYGANAFHVASGAVVLFAERLLSPAGRACVTRLVLTVAEETVWMYAEEHLGLPPGLGVYEAVVGKVPAAFPGLRRLMVVAHGTLLRRELVQLGGRHLHALVLQGDEEDPKRGVVREALFAAMDAAVAGFARPLAHAMLVIGLPAFDRLMLEEMAQAAEAEVREGQWRQFWRPLGEGTCRSDDDGNNNNNDNKNDNSNNDNNNNNNGNDNNTAVAAGESRGYWVRGVPKVHNTSTWNPIPGWMPPDMALNH
ncbi:hypothetical protein VTJ83DRAFT_5006 [Remersonia thermophila]|uniref:DUF7730 domain-containing protein n=1 Tax=Remersonia thermophila TaxID=72144 RepID=A0ABR4DBJ5_9PEZI